MRPRRFPRALLLALGLAACDSGMTEKLRLDGVRNAFGMSAQPEDPSVIKVGDDATIPILLSSNKQATTFVVNGKPLSAARMLKVMVPNSRLRVTAQAPCYRPLTQTAEANGFGAWSAFPFLFANQDRTPAPRGTMCE